MNLTELTPDAVFEGGDLDCGSGLVLLIREAMLPVPEGGLLELRSREPTVADDLPPWCRMVGHEYVGSAATPTHARYFVRKRADAAGEARALDEDKARARAYEWRLRVRAAEPLASTVYCRNFSFKVGQAASFEEKDAHPSAVELMLGALGGSLAAGFATECARAGLDADDVELTVKGRLHDVLAHLGVEDGDPSLASVAVRCFVSSGADEAALQAAWERTVARSPIAATLARAADLQHKLAVI